MINFQYKNYKGINLSELCCCSIFNGHLLQVGIRQFTNTNSTQQPETTTPKPEDQVHTLNRSNTQSSAGNASGGTETAFPLRRRSISFTKNTGAASNTGSRAPTDELQQKLNRRLSRTEDPNALEEFESQVRQNTLGRRAVDRTWKQDKPST